MTTKLFINTRPNPAPMPLLNDNGIVVRQLPLLELCPCSLDDDEKLYQNQLLTGEYQLLMAVSVPAVAYAMTSVNRLADNGLEILKNLNQNNQLKIIAVGKTTALAFEQYGLIASCPDDDNANNEGMLTLPQVKTLTDGDKVLIWAGKGGRTVFSDTLKERGVTVDKIEYYQRVIPENLIQHTKELLADRTQFDQIWVLISSGQAWEHWQIACTQNMLSLNDFGYIAMGERLATMIKEQGCLVRQVFELSQSVFLSVFEEC